MINHSELTYSDYPGRRPAFRVHRGWKKVDVEDKNKNKNNKNKNAENHSGFGQNGW